MFLDIFVTVTPLIGYLSQYRLIIFNQSVGSFSIDVCAILLIANILRIVFWFTNGFAINLLFQSFLIIFIQLLTLKLCVRLGYKKQGESTEQGFWRWDHYSSFIMFLVGFMFVMGVTAYFAIEQKLQDYGQLVGLTALSLQSTLGFPQIVTNYKNKSTIGLSYFMVFLWLVGDITKTVYFIMQSQPFPFFLCGVIQSISDIILVSQIIKYWNKHNEEETLQPTMVEQIPLK